MLTVYAPETLSALCKIAKVVSVQWTRKFYDSGGFEIHIPPRTPYVENLKSGNIICYKQNAGVIRYIHQNKNDIIICGNDLKSLLGQRIIVPPFVYNKENPTVIEGYDRTEGTVEEIMRYYVNNHTIDPFDTKRKIPNMTLANLKNIGKNAKWQSRFENLLSELTTIGQYDEIGFDVIFNRDIRQLEFTCFKGRDLSKSVIFSREYKNIDDCQYTLDDSTSVNTTYVGGDGEEESQYIEKVSESEFQGFERREDFISASGSEFEEIKDRGLSHLKEKKVSEIVEANANTKLKYKEDWDLGDYVTVKTEVLGETVIIEKQITEVKEVYEYSNIYASPVFGNKKESVIKKLMKG